MVTEMKQKLYFPIRKLSLRYAYFAYFDTKDYLADPLFMRHKVRVWYGKHFAKKGSPYLGIICRVRKCDVPQFQEALEELENSMLICGYTDYESKVSAVVKNIKRTLGVEDCDEDDPPGETKQGQTA